MLNSRVILKKDPVGSLRFGHPWVYHSQIASTEGSPANGALVDIYTQRGRFQGRGYFNPASQISVRILSREDEAIDRSFFLGKFRKAFEYRKHVVKETNAYRLVSSEADGLPGLIVDVYAETLVLQFLTAGMEMFRELVLDTLKEVIPSRGIYERSDSSSRRFEGLAEKTGWIEKNCGDAVVIVEREIEYRLEFGEGHKTGFYLDQRENRLLLRDLGLKGTALDVFCYDGAFGLHLAKAGMKVTGIEIQESNIFRAEDHRRRNGLEQGQLDFRCGNAFDLLREAEKAGERYDLVVLDPPSFVKKKSAVEGALTGYKEILLRGMKLTAPDGLLAVFSCSYHVDESLLLEVAMSAAMDTRKNLKIVKTMKQSGDHPILPFIPETYYLKGFLFEISSL